MICQNCQTEVDDDLIFCTNCGARLFEQQTEEPTILLKEPVYPIPAKTKPAKSSSNLKWVALIIALIAIPASIFGVYLLTISQRNSPVSQNINKPKTPTATPTRKANTNQNSNANVSNANVNAANSNANSKKPANKTEIMNERLEIAPKSHQTVPFAVKTETARITGKITVLEGEKIEGFVYLKKSYDEHFPDENFKMFSFSSALEVRQTLVEEKYVLVFVNDTEKPVVIQGNFALEN